MFENVIVGVDGEAGGRDAIALAKILLAEQGRLTLVHVCPSAATFWRVPDHYIYADGREKAFEILKAAADQAGIPVRTQAYVASTAGRGLHEVAETMGADLLVIGSSQRGLLHRVFVGDDTAAALNGAPCAVAIAPSGFAEHPVAMREIGVGYDGSPDSDQALAIARALATERGAKLSAFTAVSVPRYALYPRTAPDGTPLQTLVDDALMRIRQLGGIEAHAAYGQPSEELALYGASLDLLVIGSRGYGPVGRLVHGSTARELARSARCPLLVLTRAARVAQAPDESSDASGRVTAGTGAD